MSKYLKKLSLDKHQEIGGSLKDMREKLIELHTILCSTYGKNSVEVRRVIRACQGIDDLRCQLDNCVCKEFPELPNDVVLNAYYGGQRTQQV